MNAVRFSGFIRKQILKTKMPQTQLSIVIVSYNTCKILQDCLRSVFAEGSPLKLEVFVVDNASLDESVAMVQRDFPQVKLIANRVNVGFAKANNQALRQVGGDFVLLLNSDTVVKQGVFGSCIRYLGLNPGIGALTCKVLLQDGTLDLACRRSFPTPWVAFWKITGFSRLFPKSRFFARYNLTYLDENKTYDVDAIVGAFMFLPREVLLEVGMLDEQFFMYGEDLDWCYRIRQAGFKIVYHPDVSIIHYKGASSNRRQPPLMVKEFHHAMTLFYDKYFAGHNYSIANLLIRFGVWLHFMSEMLRRRLPFVKAQPSSVKSTVN